MARLNLVEVNGFEPSTSAVRRQRSTGLSYTPRDAAMLTKAPDGPEVSAQAPASSAGGADDHVDPVAFAHGAEPVEGRAGPGAAAFRDVAVRGSGAACGLRAADHGCAGAAWCGRSRRGA